MATQPATDEKDLLLRLREGNHKAFSKLYERYANLVYNRIKRLVHVHEFAEELAQDVFLQIWERREMLGIEISFQVIVLRYAKSTAINFYRKAVRDSQLKEQLILSGTELYEPLETEINFNETNAILNAAISRLPPQRQKIFILCKLEGKSYEYAATQFGISVGTIKDHMAKAMRTLRQELSNNPSVPPLYLLYIAYIIS